MKLNKKEEVRICKKCKSVLQIPSSSKNTFIISNPLNFTIEKGEKNERKRRFSIISFSI